ARLGHAGGDALFVGRSVGKLRALGHGVACEVSTRDVAGDLSGGAIRAAGASLGRPAVIGPDALWVLLIWHRSGALVVGQGCAISARVLAPAAAARVRAWRAGFAHAVRR